MKKKARSGAKRFLEQDEGREEEDIVPLLSPLLPGVATSWLDILALKLS